MTVWSWIFAHSDTDSLAGFTEQNGRVPFLEVGIGLSDQRYGVEEIFENILQIRKHRAKIISNLIEDEGPYQEKMNTKSLQNIYFKGRREPIKLYSSTVVFFFRFQYLYIR